ncbi:uncharacterized protein LOC132175400 isoform X3 [Corylus avellana]|uniref:uncharacterized protein LOC132175400 isoform X3 n=1 Tax=Corylus avellana TaxID=13451 RepID=UPI00286C218C|nr:uncharacterized protein LOC132175400 isoform X3 [Corylus avellana]
MEGHGDRGSSTLQSRLSPLAPPFNPQPTLNLLANSCQQPLTASLDHSQSSDPSFSSLDSFSDLKLDAFQNYGHQSDMEVTDLPYDNPSGFDFDTQLRNYSQYPSLALEGNSMFALPYESDFDAMPLTKSSMPNLTHNLSGFGYVGQGADGGDGPSNVEQDKRRDHQFSRKEGSRPYESFLKQGKHPAEGLKPSGEFSNYMHEKLNGTIIGGDSQIKSRGTEGVNSESFPDSQVTSLKFSTSSDICSAATIQNIPHGQWSYAMPVVTWSSCNLDVDSYKRSFSQIDSLSAEPTVSPSKNNSLPALSYGSQGTCTTVSPLNPVLAVNSDFLGTNALDKNENSSVCNPEEFYGLNGCKPCSLKKPHVLLNGKGKAVCLDQSLIGKGNERKSDKSISDDGIDPLLVIKSELQPHAIKTGASVESSSKILDENDSDVDSPCWKGTQACRSPFGVAEPVCSINLEKESETRNSLNPLAPHFFPSNAKGSIDYHENECRRSDFSSFKTGESSAVYLSSRMLKNMDSTKVGSHPSELSNGIGAQCSNGISEAKKEYALVNSRSSSLIKSSHVVQPSLVEDYFTSNGKRVIGANAEGSLKGIENVVCSGLTSVPFLAKEHALSPTSGVARFTDLSEMHQDAWTNAEGSLKGIKDVVHTGQTRVPVLAKEQVSPSSSGVGLLSDLTETHQDVSKSLFTPPKIDVPKVINAMHDLTELIVQNCSNGLHSLNAYEHDIIQRIIHKLYVFSSNRVGQRISMPESTPTGTPYCPFKPTEHSKCSDVELRLAWTKTMAVPLEPDYQNYHEAQKSFYTVFTEKGLDSFSSCSDVWAEKGNDIIQGRLDV